MTDHASHPPISLDPLIAEARQRARRRRLGAILASTVVVALAAAWLDLRPTGAAQTAPSAAGVTSAVPRLLGSFGTSGGVLWATDRHGALWLTLDGGRTWGRTLRKPNLGLGEQVQFVDARHGWFIGARDSASPWAIERTVDGGRTWQTSSLPDRASIPGVLSFYDARHGYVLADQKSGKGSAPLFWTKNGGASWRLVAGPHHFGSITFVDRRDGFLVTAPGPGGLPAALYRTTDGGKTWSKQPVRPPYFGGLLTRSFGRGLVVGDWKTPPNKLWIYASLDAGAHWTAIVPPAPATWPTLFAAGSARTWVVASNRGLVVTHDGGHRWSTMVPRGLPRPLDLRELDFGSARTGWVLVGQGGLYRTTDGGRHWKPSACAAAHLTCPADASYSSQAPPHGGRGLLHG